MGETSAPKLSPRSATALVIANMIGVGVFTTSGYALADLGSASWVVAAWAVGGLIALAGAFCYGALIREICGSGGEYLFLSRGLHPLAGFLSGWTSLLAGFTGPVAAAALAAPLYLRGAFGLDLEPRWTASGLVLLAWGLHGRGARWGVAAQDLAVGLKLLAILCLCVGGLVAVAGSDASSNVPERGFDLGAFASTLVWISFAYSGWNAAVYVAGEVEDAKRTVGRAMITGTAIVIVAYVALNALILAAAPASELTGRGDVAVVAAHALGGDSLARVVGGLVGLALFTSVSAMTMAGPRVYAQMSEDGLFPRMFRSGDGPPTMALHLQCVLALAAVWATGLRELLGWIGFTLGLFTATSVFVLLRLKWKAGAALAVPGFPGLPIFFLACTLGATGFMAHREPVIAFYGVLGVAAGIPFYILFRRT
ncbi:MAG TPA: amino acid permease [Planctomycetes bacterium]|nr:amino acid permease [Planctomycetota bacterium]